MPWTNEELKKIREDLPKNGSKELADKFDMKPGSIRNILSGLSTNDEVVLAAFELGQEYQKKLNAVKTQLSA